MKLELAPVCSPLGSCAVLPLADPAEPIDPVRLRWMVTIHLTFVVSGLLLAGMDWVTSRTVSHSASRG